MIRMKISVSDAHLEQLQYILSRCKSVVDPEVLPMTKGALAEGAALIQTTWVNHAMRYPMAGKYVNTIHSRQTGPFEYEVSTEAKEAVWIENGTKELDMKTTHPFGPRSRVSNEGFPYLIVPFRHGTPKSIGFKSVMPSSVWNKVKKYKMMRTDRSADAAPEKDKTHNYASYYGASGKKVGRAKYSKGYGRLQGEEHGNMNGMVRSTDETGKDRSGGYFTFRVISAKQLVTRPHSWIKPAMPARLVTKFVVQETEKDISEMVEGALAGDMR